MFGGAVAFFVIAVIAALMGYSAFAGMSLNIAWILLLFGLIFAALFFVSEHASHQESGEGSRR